MNIANKLTLARIIMIPFFIIFAIPTPEWLSEPVFSFHNIYGTLIALIIFVIASLTDLLDGYYARKLKLVTNLGKFIDPIADKILITSALIIMVQRTDIAAYTVVIIITRDLIVDGLRLVVSQKGQVIAANIYGKIKTNLQIISICIYLVDFYIDLWYIPQIIYAIALIATVYSGIIYIKASLKFLSD
ncbi:MAG TPA: CDP-diacylglycerol--glycerol-3-phosphate 3-phosphatidyltransferase [Clostridia bacterium]|nr:MAG: CDP-diacylglycerol--glycerol-3-phosphate 3-phosphatidyltransferase [Firmicutes bacterium ADurb.Bin146]HOD92437.1 CDP-diacylglycerol--glycerol-3-phosphate 3-phosphatidyltransferase [Clostridia bacterium]HQM38794.1 CDP-diacylglycerol--glycerol-3-phosphate 3-phosphatidyltransferase [Clostridia bacterium]